MFRRIKDRVKHKGHQKQPSSSTIEVGTASQNASKTDILRVEEGNGKQHVAVTVAPASTGHSESSQHDKKNALSHTSDGPPVKEGATKADAPAPSIDVKTQITDSKTKTSIAESSTFSPTSPSPPSPPPPYELSLWDRAYDALATNDAKLVASYEKLLDAEAELEKPCTSYVSSSLSTFLFTMALCLY